MNQYHWIVTLQWKTPTGNALTVDEGTITPDPGQTRQQAFKLIRDLAIARRPDPALDSPVVLFFSLESNEL